MQYGMKIKEQIDCVEMTRERMKQDMVDHLAGIAQDYKEERLNYKGLKTWMGRIVDMYGVFTPKKGE